MFDLTETHLGQVFVHRVGNKTRGEETLLSTEPLQLNEMLERKLIQYFFKGIKPDTTFSTFHHDENINLNEAHSFIDEFYLETSSFYSLSRKIANLLVRVSTHPNIRSGDLFIAELKNIKFGDELFKSALGIFKSEQKSSFIKLGSSRSSLTASVDSGINPEVAEKGVLVLPSQGSYRLLVHNNRKIDSVYWSELFLGCIDEDSPKLRTKLSIDAVSTFVKSVPTSELSKVEKIDSIECIKSYVSENDTFNIDQLESELGFNNTLKDDLREHIKDYENSKHVTLTDSFEIDKEQASKSKKALKENIVLDESIEIKVNLLKTSKKRVLEKGFDSEKKMHYYKIYFHEEK